MSVYKDLFNTLKLIGEFPLFFASHIRPFFQTRAGEVLVDGKEWKVIRQPQSYEEMMINYL